MGEHAEPVDPRTGPGTEEAAPALAAAVLDPHTSIRGMMLEATSTASHFGEPRRVFALTDTFLATLSRHLAAVEDVIYPMVRRRIDGGRQLTKEQVHLSRRMERRMRMIEGALNGDSYARDVAWSDQWTDMARMLEAHEAAEHRLVDRLTEILDEQEQAALAQSFRAAVKKAPTRPHPYSPHSPLLSGATHRLWSLADRAMDEMDGRIIPHEPPKPHPANPSLSAYVLGMPMFEVEAAADEEEEQDRRQ